MKNKTERQKFENYAFRQLKKVYKKYRRFYPEEKGGFLAMFILRQPDGTVRIEVNNKYWETPEEKAVNVAYRCSI
jgi:hypothetical protein